MNIRTTFLLLSLPAVCVAQPVVAPANAQVGSTRGQDVAGYNILNSFETGYRWHTVGGSMGKYRSDVNFGNGLRLLGSNLMVNSKEGHGGYFDELLISTQGLGNDPYQFASARVAKNTLYRYDMLWRLNEYYNPALPLAAGQHFMNTTRTLQDHSLVLLPQSKLRLLAGYSRVRQGGPALSTFNFIDTRNDEFALDSDVRRLQNEYRLGVELRLLGATFTVMRGWETFREDTRLTSGPNSGNNLEDRTALRLFRRDEPYHGTTRNWRLNLLWDKARLITFNGRYTWADGRRNFVFDEAAFGVDRIGAARNRQILVGGDARRPVTTAAFTASIFPTPKLTVVNHTAFHHTRIDGDATYSEIDNATLDTALAHFQLLGIRTLTNSTDVNYRPSGSFAVFGGYQFSTRRIRSVEQVSFAGEPETLAAEQTNDLHAGRFGVRWHLTKAFSVTADGEVGRANRPIYPVSERNYHVLGGRVQYKTRTVYLQALVRTNYNTNSASLTAHSARSRTYAADASWAVRPWLNFDANWSKLHLDTLSGIAYFFNRALTNDRSIYISNIHTGHLGARIVAGPRLEIFAAYSRIEDVGDSGRTAPAVFTPGSLAFQSYPLAFESPLARISLRLHRKVVWNAGYQHYKYRENLMSVQNYRAHTGFTSLTWTP